MAISDNELFAVRNVSQCDVVTRLSNSTNELLVILDPYRYEVVYGASPCTEPPAYEAWVRTDSGEHHMLVCEKHAPCVRWPEGKIVNGYSSATCMRMRTFVYTDAGDMAAATLRDLLSA